jgi:hypothetical protein
MKYLKNAFLDKLLENDVTKTIFDNIRNFLYCALFLAMGTQAIVTPSSTIGFYEIGVVTSGLILIVVSLILMALNILDGIHKLSKVGIHTIAYPFIILIYILVAIRVVIFAWGYRLH